MLGEVLTDARSLRRLRSLILEDAEGTYMSGAFVHLEAATHVQVHMGRSDLVPLNDQLLAIRNRLVDLEVICSKLDWMRESRNAGQLDRFAWMLFASNDVVGFLTHLRSLLDHVAKALHAVAIQPGQVPKDSFQSLRRWAAKGPDRAEASLGAEAVATIADTAWFPPLRALRDGLIHSNHKAIVFPGEEGTPIPRIDIQIWMTGYRNGLDEPGLLDPANPNVAVFERLASAALARTHDLLEALSGPLGSYVGLDASGMSPQARHGGLRIIGSWLDMFLEDLDTSTAAEDSRDPQQPPGTT